MLIFPCWARGTPGFSGADLANMVNEAALAAARQNRKAVLMYDFELAKDKVLMGVERKSMLLSDEEKKNTAYHEAGHALVAALLPHSDPLHKVTIIPRGMALGVTMQLPIDDRHNYYKNYLETSIAILMGGRLAEEMFLNSMSTGAGNDIERATEMARKMVCEWGMSDLGPLTFGKKEEQIFLGREIAQHRDYSEATAVKIDAEVQKLVKRRLQHGEGSPVSQPRCAGSDCARADRARSAGRSADQDDHRRPGTAEDRSSAQARRRSAAGDQARPAAGTGQRRREGRRQRRAGVRTSDFSKTLGRLNAAPYFLACHPLRHRFFACQDARSPVPAEVS